MAAQYNVELRNKQTGDREFVYVFASDYKAGYKKAAKRAVERLAKKGKTGVVAVAARCVG